MAREQLCVGGRKMRCWDENYWEYGAIAMVGRMYESLRATRGWVKDCVATSEVLDLDESSESYEQEEGKS